MKLTAIQVKTAKPKDKSYKLYDGMGLFLEVSPKGHKWWRYKYRIDGKEKKFALGVYPEVSLKDAREKLLDARKLVKENIDPVAHRRKTRMERTSERELQFEILARQWHEKYKGTVSKKHSKDVLHRLEKDIFPFIGKKPIAEITANEFLKILERVQKRGAVETAFRLLWYCRSICGYANFLGCLQVDFTLGVKKLLKKPEKKHLASITNPKKLSKLLREIERYEGHDTTRLAIKFSMLVFLRPGEIRKAEWSEIDFERARWDVPAEKMKTKKDHIVPLATQAIEILKELKAINGNSKYVFPSILSRARPMSNNTVNMALRRMGFTKEETCAHGFRATARTILEEVLKYPGVVVEPQLAHKVKDPLGTAYNRTTHLEARIPMMQVWADYLDELKESS